jgi:uncharacterized repeat protein (TIGR01451 family)
MKLKSSVMAFIIGLLVFASIAGFAPTAIAKGENSAVVGTLSQNRIVQVDGKEVLQSADAVKPGDLIEYQLKYANKGATSVSNMMVTLPIPKGLVYVGAMAPSAKFASLDGVKFESIPIKRTVRTADGKEVVQDVPLNEYRALRWDAGQLEAGKVSLFSARARVEPTSDKK